MIKIYGQPNCQWCEAAKSLCKRRGVEFIYIDIRELHPDEYRLMRKEYEVPETWRTVPIIMAAGEFIGGYAALEQITDHLNE